MSVPTTRLRLFLRLSVLALLLWSGATLLVAWTLTRRARPRAPEPPPSLSWGKPEEVRLTTPDGEDLGAWWFPVANSHLCAIVLHGHGESRRAVLDLAALYVRAGHSVLAPTLRAHGDSSGQHNDFGRSAAEDVRTAAAFARARTTEARILVHGRSLGAVAAILAGDLGPSVVGYVLESPYTNLSRALCLRLQQALPSGLDALALRSLQLLGPLVLDDPWSIAPIFAVSELPKDVPILFLAGGADRLCPTEDVARVQRNAPGDTQLVVLADAVHGGLGQADPGLYDSTILSFVARVASP